MTATTLVPPGRKKFGLISLLLAAAAFALVVGSLGIFLAIPNEASESILDAATWFFVVSFLFIAPLLDVAGIVLGIAALFRSGDRKLLGFVGVALNAFLLAGGIVLGMLLIASVGGVR